MTEETPLAQNIASRDGAQHIVLVTGPSGAGRSTAAKCLEDMGWFVADNLPPELISTMVDLGSRTSGDVTRIGWWTTGLLQRSLGRSL